VADEWINAVGGQGSSGEDVQIGPIPDGVNPSKQGATLSGPQSGHLGHSGVAIRCVSLG
jgi:hypothetical protein